MKMRIGMEGKVVGERQEEEGRMGVLKGYPGDMRDTCTCNGEEVRPRIEGRREPVCGAVDLLVPPILNPHLPSYISPITFREFSL